MFMFYLGHRRLSICIVVETLCIANTQKFFSGSLLDSVVSYCIPFSVSGKPPRIHFSIEPLYSESFPFPRPATCAPPGQGKRGPSSTLHSFPCSSIPRTSRIHESLQSKITLRCWWLLYPLILTEILLPFCNKNLHQTDQFTLWLLVARSDCMCYICSVFIHMYRTIAVREIL